MEQKINLETAPTSYHLSQEELKKMYIALALAMYDHLREPNYNEAKLAQTLRADFKQFLRDIQLLLEQMPKNPRLRGMFTFFENHCNALKQVTHELRKSSEDA